MCESLYSLKPQILLDHHSQLEDLVEEQEDLPIYGFKTLAMNLVPRSLTMISNNHIVEQLREELNMPSLIMTIEWKKMRHLQNLTNNDCHIFVRCSRCGEESAAKCLEMNGGLDIGPKI